MDAKFKAKWVAALRSGLYQQTTRVLRDSENRMCCLGVACDLLVQEGKGQWYHHPPMLSYKAPPYSYVYEGQHYETIPPKMVLRALGLDPSLCVLKDKDGMKRPVDFHLAVLNDFQRWNFKRIADYIEKTL